MSDHWLTEDLNEAVHTVRKGGVILYPTDTIWGLGCDATNLDAIERIYSIKGRRPEKPFVLLASDLEMVKKYVREIHPRVETLLHYHERPLTLVYKHLGNLPPVLYADGKTVAIRIARDAFCRELIASCGVPLVSTSANKSDAPFAANFAEIDEEIKEAVDYIVKHRQGEKQEFTPSVIASFDRKGMLHFIRN